MTGHQPAESLFSYFDGSALDAKSDLAAYVVTIGADGWPHAAMVSAGEVLLDRDGWAGLALWPTSRTTANVRRDGRVVLLAVLNAEPVRARLDLREAEQPGAEASGADPPDAPAPDAPVVLFHGTVADVARDTAAYATVEAGVTFTLKDPADTLARWRRTIEALRSLRAGAES